MTLVTQVGYWGKGGGTRLGTVIYSIAMRGPNKPRRVWEDTKGSQVDRFDATRYSGSVSSQGRVAVTLQMQARVMDRRET